MNVLWFEVTEPCGYNQKNSFVCGWQDSLERILSKQKDIKLSIAFESSTSSLPRTKGNINYIPLCIHKNLLRMIKSEFSWMYNSKELISKMKDVIKSVKPDIIHVFGTEWPFGLITKHTSIPVVIHIQGSITEINKYIYPKNYSFWGEAIACFPSIRQMIETVLKPIKNTSRLLMEKKIWETNNNYMGRTQWDKDLSLAMHPNRNYFHVDEALREIFVEQSSQWQFKKRERITLITNGGAPFWKGPNILLRTAKLLKHNGIKFVWLVIGEMPNHLKIFIEKKERTSFEENYVHFLGWQEEKQIQEKLIDATLYIHCSYIDNSPNAICEAQCVGIPIISTNVGGISSLIENEKTGFLVPPNRPKELADRIISLKNNEELLKKVSHASIITAQKRHNPQNIAKQLLNCYNNILSTSQKNNIYT